MSAVKRFLISLVVGIALIYGASSPLQAESPPIVITTGHSTVYALVEPVKRVAIGDPSVAEIRVLDNSALYILGRKIGTTNLMIWPRSGATPLSVDLRVTRDVSALQADIARLFPQETQLRVTANGESIVLGGALVDPTNAIAIVDLAKQFAGADKVSNLMTGASAPQVLLEVKVAEVSKTLIDRLGAKLNLTSGTSRTITLLGSFLSGAAGTVTGVDGTDSATIDAETRNGLIKILAEPTIVALSGEQGEFLAGGKIFIPVAQGSTGGVNGGAITLEEREFGVGVKFLPTVMRDERINLKVSAEVSEISNSGTSISAGGQNTAVLPTITSRKTATTIQLADGQSFAVGGLTKDNVKGTAAALPGLSSLPILGALFRSTDFQNDRSELVFVVTARILRDPAQKIRLPTDGFKESTRTERFLGGDLESQQRPAQR
ncbi:MAG: type II and III secretion system protein family protein [Steroidobacteraceae bacterium]